MAQSECITNPTHTWEVIFAALRPPPTQQTNNSVCFVDIFFFIIFARKQTPKPYEVYFTMACTMNIVSQTTKNNNKGIIVWKINCKWRSTKIDSVIIFWILYLSSILRLIGISRCWQNESSICAWNGTLHNWYSTMAIRFKIQYEMAPIALPRKWWGRSPKGKTHRHFNDIRKCACALDI